jgi:hypothetical protein
MRTEVTVRCTTCPYAVQTAGLEGREWECRRHAPTGSNHYGGNHVSPTHPHMIGERHWCGDHPDFPGPQRPNR